MTRFLIIITLVLSFGMVSLGLSDEIVMNNGNRITCVIIAKDAQNVLAETEYGTITLSRKSIAELKPDYAVNNYVLRGDFLKKKGKLEDALRYYSEAMLTNPKNTIARDKYNELRKQLDDARREQAFNVAKQASDQNLSATKEDIAAGKIEKKLGNEGNMAMTAEGSARYPMMTPKGENKDKLTIQRAKLDALRKIFPDGIGYGFITKGDKVQILPDGEIPNVKIEVIEKNKLNMGYNVRISVSGPASSVIVTLPPDYPIVDAVGQTADIKAKIPEDLRGRAVKDAIEQTVRTIIKNKIAANPKNAGRKYFGRVYVTSIVNESLVPSGYMIQAKLKVWFDPACENN